MRLPADVLAMAGRSPQWATWVESLPRLSDDVLDDWALTLDGEPQHGHCSLVLPVRADGEPAVLKLGFVEAESELEHLALQQWAGDGVVRLLRARPRVGALLLERLGSTSLASMDAVAACELVGERYARLHRPASPQFRRLSEEAARWAEKLAHTPRSAALPHRMVEHATALLRSFATDEATDGRLIHTDLHDENVLAGAREPWLVIDPKPLNGDPHYEVAPLLWNRWEELSDTPGGLRGAIRRRFFAVVDAAGLDEDRARAWVVVRMMLNAHDEASEPTPDRGWMTRCISVVKAMQE